MSHEAAQPAVLVERRDRVMIITLNRPEAMNAINGDLSHGLLDAVQELDADPALTAGVLTGAGRAFTVGLDLKELGGGAPGSAAFAVAVETGSLISPLWRTDHASFFTTHRLRMDLRLRR